MQSEKFWLLTEITVADDRHYAEHDLFLAEAVGSSLLCLKGAMRALRITMSLLHCVIVSSSSAGVIVQNT